MTVYCGVDFHACQQTLAYCDTQDGELKFLQLQHADRVALRRFYTQLPAPVVVGLEAGGYSDWFERLRAELGVLVQVGNPTEIRRRARSRQKNDWRDAELLLDLLLKDECPRIQRHSTDAQAVLGQLRYRHKLVQLRTRVTKALHALALRAGLCLRSALLSQAGRAKLKALPLTSAQANQRDEWLALIEQLSDNIKRVERELTKLAAQAAQVKRVRTHPGIGLLTGLALVHTLKPVSRFANGRKVTAYVGLEPREYSSDTKQRWRGISKAGSPLLRFLLVEAAQHAARADAELKHT